MKIRIWASNPYLQTATGLSCVPSHPCGVTRSVLRAFSAFRPGRQSPEIQGRGPAAAPCQPDAPNAPGRNRTLVSGSDDRGSATELPTHRKTGGRPSAAGDVSRGRPRGGRTPAYAVVGLSAVSGRSGTSGVEPGAPSPGAVLEKKQHNTQKQDRSHKRRKPCTAPGDGRACGQMANPPAVTSY